MSIVTSLARVSATILIAAIAITFAGYLKGVFSNDFRKSDVSKQAALRILEDIIVLVIRIIILGLALSFLGVDVSGLVGLASIAAVSIGYAFQDVATNIIAGIFIIILGKIKKGDQIFQIFEEHPMEGEIVDIGIRSTMLRLDNDMIHVPNNILFNGVVGVKPVSKIM